MKNVTILGVTGSIGQQTVDVIANNKNMFNLVGISAGYNIDLLEEILLKIDVENICVISESDANYLQTKYPSKNFFWGESGLISISTIAEVDIVINGIVGFAGLLPTIEAIKKGKDIGLANKETLVVAGHLIMDLVKQHEVQLLPVDSEHSAIFQSLQGKCKNDIKRIILTASGGSFRDYTREELTDVTVEQALNHPNWSMGAKITVDSASMFNKGLEVIEAKWLFDVDYDQIEVVIHPQSILHSAVEFKDTSIIGQFGLPDMRLPIQYALTYPHRIELVNSKSLDLFEIGKLEFIKPAFKRFKALELSYLAGKTGGSMPCVLNAANEKANELFRKGKIKFLDIEFYVEKAMNNHKLITNPSLEVLVKLDSDIREYIDNEVRNANNN